MTQIAIQAIKKSNSMLFEMDRDLDLSRVDTVVEVELGIIPDENVSEWLVQDTLYSNLPDNLRAMYNLFKVYGERSIDYIEFCSINNKVCRNPDIILAYNFKEESIDIWIKSNLKSFKDYPMRVYNGDRFFFAYPLYIGAFDPKTETPDYEGLCFTVAYEYSLLNSTQNR
jgi:hypothetical protein